MSADPLTEASLFEESTISVLEGIVLGGSVVGASSLPPSLLQQPAAGSSSSPAGAAAAAAAAASVSHARAGRALLRLYGLFPARVRREAVLASLAHAMALLPRSDFQLALCLVPPPLRADASVAALEAVEQALQVGRFAALWAAARAPAAADALAAVPGWATGIRAFQLAALNRLYQRIALAELGAYLDLVRAAAAAASCAA